MAVRTRFAPSPTGYLHIGGVRTALFNWLFARRHGGQFLLRVDDTDAERNVAAALRPILDGFRWLGLDWDEGPEVGGPYAPYFQSQRSARYAEAVERLLASGAAYRDYATGEEIQAEREAAQRDKRRFLYSRRWMAETDAQAARFEAEGRRAAVRLKMPRDGVCAFRDLVRGDVEFEWGLEQDHVVRRADGTCLYHLASAVDDHDFAITHVIRAVEHLSNTPRQLFIMTALGYEPPAFAHVPYVAAPGGAEKLSKRKLDRYLRHHEFKAVYDRGLAVAERSRLAVAPETFNPVVVDFYRAVGYEPDALLNYLLLLGWSLDDRTERFTRDEMVAPLLARAASTAPRPASTPGSWPRSRSGGCRRSASTTGWRARRRSSSGRASSRRRRRRTSGCASRDVVRAAGDRIKVAGDVLDYPEFFQTPTPTSRTMGRRSTSGCARTRRGSRRCSAGSGTGSRRPGRSTRPPSSGLLPRCTSSSRPRASASAVGTDHPRRPPSRGDRQGSVGFGLFEGLAILGPETRRFGNAVKDVCLYLRGVLGLDPM